jgi:hypothetical protein
MTRDVGIITDTSKNMEYQGEYIHRKSDLMLTIGCAMDFSDYPFDSHVCDLLVSDNDGVYAIRLWLGYVWYMNQNKTETTLESGIFDQASSKGLPFEIKISGLGSQNYTAFSEYHDSYGSLTFAFTGIRLLLRRQSTQVISSYFLPTMLYVCISWISFAIPVNQAS